MKTLKSYLLYLLLLLALVGCESLAPNPTPIVVVITPIASDTPPPTTTFTPAPTFTPEPTATPAITATPTPPDCITDGGQIIDFDENRSTIANENLRYRVYVPPCYIESGVRYPYVILLHGLAATERQWLEIGLQEVMDTGVAAGSIAPMIVVMPYMGDIGVRNDFPPQPSFENVILEEFVPAIERDFCTWNDRDYRAIGGISRGGYWAYTIALRHPDIFGIVGGHSAYFPNNVPAIPEAFSPLDIALNSSELPGAELRMYIDTAAGDDARTGQQLFSSRLASRGISHRYEINPVGDHSNAYWAEHLPEYMAFYGEDWPRNPDDLPTCLEPSP